MSFSRVYSAQPYLLNGQIVTVETDITPNTLHAFSIVGLGDKAVEEAKDRVSSALKNCGYPSPKQQNQKVVVSLSPADIKKEGSSFDLAIAVSYLVSHGEIVTNTEKSLFLGELALNGEIRGVKGVLPIVKLAKESGYENVFVPAQNAREAALIRGIKVFAVSNLRELIEHIREKKENPLIEGDVKVTTLFPNEETPIETTSTKAVYDLSDIRGQESAKRGLEIAAAGGHNIALYGPPGTGKTMLARVFTNLLPQLTVDEILEITGIHSIAGTLTGDYITEVPFRSPHHTSSYVSVIGGGTIPKPGEVTLAHKGVLFLDEFPEFDKKVIESLRQPLEDNVVSISRAKGTAVFPSNFILIAAMNPCPCGNLTSKVKRCTCRETDLVRYRRKLSGPIMDRIDMWVSVGDIDLKTLGENISEGESTDTVRARVGNARAKQIKRFENSERKIGKNSDMNAKDLGKYAPLDEKTRNTLEASATKLGLSARAYHRVQKLARTIADLDEKDEIEESHILEALQYRPKINI